MGSGAAAQSWGFGLACITHGGRAQSSGAARSLRPHVGVGGPQPNAAVSRSAGISPQVPESISEVRALQLEGEEAAALFLPSATASWRLNLLRSGGLPDHRIASLECAPRPQRPLDSQLDSGPRPAACSPAASQIVAYNTCCLAVHGRPPT